MALTIPQWQVSELQSLQAQGKLSGVDWQYLAVIDQAESSGSGGGINSSGYGGWFGTGVGQVPPSVLASTSVQAFDEQAQVAAADYAALLQSHGGDPLAAEMAYQGGSTEGAQLMQQDLGGLGTSMPTLTGYNPTAGTPNAPGMQPGSGGFPLFGTPFGSVTLPSGIGSRIVIGLVALILLYVGVKELFNSSHDGVQTVVMPVREGTQHVKNAGKKSAEVAGAAAA